MKKMKYKNDKYKKLIGGNGSPSDYVRLPN